MGGPPPAPAAGTRTNAYDRLINHPHPWPVWWGGNYSLLLDPINAAGALVTFQAGITPGYFATHMKQRSSVIFWSGPAGTYTYYPGYGYVGSQSGESLYSIDNILVRYPPAVPPTPIPPLTILNSVTGAPFKAPPPPAPAIPPPLGGLQLNTAMPISPTTPIPTPQFLPLVPPPTSTPPQYWPLPFQAPALVAGMFQTYRSWDYIGIIHATSDHFALVSDI
jgi:hypothetical protein